MKYKQKILLPVVLIIGLIIGVLGAPYIQVNVDTYQPYFKIIGDIENPLMVYNIEDFENVSIDYNGSTLKGIPMNKLLEVVNPLVRNSTVLFVGVDGLIAEVDMATLEKSYINFSVENGWNALQMQHPISSHIKHIKEIVVVSSETYNDFGVNIFSEHENLRNITCGQLYKSDFIHRNNFEGTSQIENKSTTNYVTIYTSQKLLPLNNLYPAEAENKLVIFGKDGSQTMLSDNGFLRMEDNSISFLSDKGTEVKDIAGIYCGRTLHGNTDVYYDTDHYLSNNEKVMVILVDGFSYEQYEYAKVNHYLPYLSSYKASKVFSAVKPVTNTGFTTMITGQTPDIHGIHDRSKREFEGVSIFGKAKEYGLNPLLIEGDIKIINTEVEPILNIDVNKNGDIDDEVLASAKANLENADLCFIHFHGVDDRGHTRGPLADETLQYITIIDGYIKELVSQWDGHVIVTADHGMHVTETAGDHGVCRYEDMIIPYIIIQ